MTTKSGNRENKIESRKPAVPPKRLSNLNRGTSMVLLETDLDEKLDNIGSIDAISVDNLSVLRDFRLTRINSENCIDSGGFLSRTPSIRAVPPVDHEDGLHFVIDKPQPLSLLSLNGDTAENNELSDVSAANQYSLDSTNGNRIVDSTSSISDSVSPMCYSMQSSMRIEPSPERTLEPPKHSRSPKLNKVGSSEMLNESGRKVVTANEELREDADGQENVEPRKKVVPENREIVQKLDRFFGESKPGFTALESAVYKKLVSGQQELAASQASALDAAMKFKKSSALSLSQKIVNIQSTVNQFKIPKKAVGDREAVVQKSKDHTTWRGKVSRKFKKHGVPASDTGEEANSVSTTFGVPLDTCTTSNRMELVPLIVEVCVHIVEKLGLDSQGVYRVPGHTASVNEIVEEVNNRSEVECISTDNERWTDVNVVASIMKLFFRKLPEALCTDQLYESLIAANRMQNREKAALKLKRLLQELPDQNYETLKYLMQHLSRVAQRRDLNRMDSHNLAMMFGPSLIRPNEESMTNMVRDIEDQSCIVDRFIQHVGWYFGDWTADIATPLESKTFDSASSAMGGGTSNLQLLASAETLVALQRDNDAVGEAGTVSGNQEDSNAGGGGLFHLGSGRLSRKNKKSMKESRDDLGGIDLNREVELHRVVSIAPSDQRMVGSSPALTRTDLAHKVSMSITGKQKIKRRYTEKPIEVRITHERVGSGGSSIWQSEKSWQYVEEDTRVPLSKKEAEMEAVVEIKRYPAYNFVDTTIKRQNPKPKCSTDIPEPGQLKNDDKKDYYYSSQTISSFPVQPRPQLAPPKSSVAMWNVRQNLESIPSREDDVFGCGFDSYETAVSSERLESVGSPTQRFKRYSEADASRFMQRNDDNFVTRVENNEHLILPSSKANRFTVVIRSPEGRRYYVLETDRPSVFFAENNSKDGCHSNPPSSGSRKVVEKLKENEIHMIRNDCMASVIAESQRQSADDIELRHVVFCRDTYDMTTV